MSAASDIAAAPEVPSEPAPPPASAVKPSLRRVFRHRNYRLFFFGQIVSLIGTWVQSIAQAWLVFRLTGSPFMLGLVAFASQAPVFFLTAVGGTIADRVDRRAILIVTQTASLAQAAALAVLTLTGLVEVWHVIALSLFLGVVNSLDIPTRQAFTIEMVGREDLQHAIALNSMMFNAARIIGPALAGLIVAAVGEGPCFAINAVTYTGVLASLLVMKKPRAERPKPRHPYTEMKEGFRYLLAHRQILVLLSLLALVSVAGAPYLTLMPVVAEDILHSGAKGLGFLMTAVGIGAMAGAFAMSRVKFDRLKPVPAWGAAAFGAFVIAFSASTDFALSFALILPAAFSLMIQAAASNAIVQHVVEDRMRGRVMAYYTMAFLGVFPFGGLAAGALAHAIGVQWTLSIGGAICILGGLAATGVKIPRRKK